MKLNPFLILILLLAVEPVRAQNSTRPETVRAGEFKKIYDPGVNESEPWYINDHCFIHAKDGQWHLFGITRQEPAKPMEEITFAHATADSLTQSPWKKEPAALTVAREAPWREGHLWAPSVILHDDLYYMFYCAGGSNNMNYRIHLATSPDLKTWTRSPKNPMLVDGYDARDPFILRVNGKWVMYYTATSRPEGGHHIVAYVTSNDLVTWTDRGVAFTDPSTGTWGGPTESPFVVHRGKFYYLFIGPRDNYDSTHVFASEDPFHWDVKNKVGDIPAHAAEVVQDTDGKWYVSRAGWGKGGVYLAPLIWENSTTPEKP
ncbi:MAG TPA: family 43 glycosylhydrolase [Verrucomicrobiae bacterium]|nr:family 43 glycosylhydrolase [Verrucomicrobiae bacterium]